MREIMANHLNASGHAKSYFKHDPIDINGRHDSIRLVKVLPDLSREGFIQCQLRAHSFPPASWDSCHTTEDFDDEPWDPTDYSADPNDWDIDVPVYKCLSYTWGPPQEDCIIKINGRVLLIRRNLWEFLCVAQDQYSGQAFWIDALCIGQTNTVERNHQVKQMGRIYSRAQMVYVWLGNKHKLSSLLHYLSIKKEEQNQWLQHALEVGWKSDEASRGGRQEELFSDSGAEYKKIFDTLGMDEFWTRASRGDRREGNDFDAHAKSEKLFETFAMDEFWTRAWVTQEIVLARRVFVLAGSSRHELRSLARIIQNQTFSYLGHNGFEHFADILADKKELKNWSLINLLRHFRDKKCAIKRDRVYSLLALCGEGRELDVDYSISDRELLVYILRICENLLCLCSVAVVAQALGPWDQPFPAKSREERPFVELHMYAIELSERVCPLCRNWVPCSWTRKEGLVFCLYTACGDTHGHLFLECPSASSSQSPKDKLLLPPDATILFQSRRANRSKVLGANGDGMEVVASGINVFIVRFGLDKLLEVLSEELLEGEPGLRSCGQLWRGGEKVVEGLGRLGFCEGMGAL